MVRVAISVEGATEERFSELVLKPYLEQKNIFITPINMRGNINLRRVKREIEILTRSFDFVTTFYDFYGFKGKEHQDTKDTLESKMTQDINIDIVKKVIPYVQMYEFEGLIFSNPSILSSELIHKDKNLSVEDWANNILVDFENNPEKINNSEQTAPSKRLMKYTNYTKTTHGPNIAYKIGLAEIREKCKGFDKWLKTIENLVENRQ